MRYDEVWWEHELLLSSDASSPPLLLMPQPTPRRAPIPRSDAEPRVELFSAVPLCSHLIACLRVCPAVTRGTTQPLRGTCLQRHEGWWSYEVRSVLSTLLQSLGLRFAEEWAELSRTEPCVTVTVTVTDDAPPLSAPPLTPLALSSSATRNMCGSFTSRRRRTRRAKRVRTSR